jgi:hypothetical protein
MTWGAGETPVKKATCVGRKPAVCAFLLLSAVALLVRTPAFCENSVTFSLGSFLLLSSNSLMTPYEFGRSVKLAVTSSQPTPYEKTWQPKQRSYGGTVKLIPPMTPDMAAPGRAGGAYRPAIARPAQLRAFGRPEHTEQLRFSPSGDAEVYNPQAEYDARPNDT